MLSLNQRHHHHLYHNTALVSYFDQNICRVHKQINIHASAALGSHYTLKTTASLSHRAHGLSKVAAANSMAFPRYFSWLARGADVEDVGEESLRLRAVSLCIELEKAQRLLECARLRKFEDPSG